MRYIGIISDTHGTFDETLRLFLRDVDEIWHAGDIGSLELADEIAAYKPFAGRIGQYRRRHDAPRLPHVSKFRMRGYPRADDPHRRLPSPLRPARRGAHQALHPQLLHLGSFAHPAGNERPRLSVVAH